MTQISLMPSQMAYSKRFSFGKPGSPTASISNPRPDRYKRTGLDELDTRRHPENSEPHNKVTCLGWIGHQHKVNRKVAIMADIGIVFVILAAAGATVGGVLGSKHNHHSSPVTPSPTLTNASSASSFVPTATSSPSVSPFSIPPYAPTGVPCPNPDYPDKNRTAVLFYEGIDNGTAFTPENCPSLGSVVPTPQEIDPDHQGLEFSLYDTSTGDFKGDVWKLEGDGNNPSPLNVAHDDSGSVKGYTIELPDSKVSLYSMVAYERFLNDTNFNPDNATYQEGYVESLPDDPDSARVMKYNSNPDGTTNKSSTVQIGILKRIKNWGNLTLPEVATPALYFNAFH